MDAALATAAARQSQVDAVLARLFSLARKRAEPLGPAYVELWDRIEASTTGGKRFRPRRVFAAYGALGGVVLLMTWLYVTAFVLLLATTTPGAQLPASLDVALRAILHEPVRTGAFRSLYPVFPWIAVVILGFVAGRDAIGRARP